MKLVVLGILLATGLAATVGAEQNGDFFSQRVAMQTTPAPQVAAGSELIVVSASLGEKGQMLTVVDPRQQVIGVYHIDLATGKITLKSVRRIQWDLQITDFNTENPLPQEIRSRLEQR